MRVISGTARGRRLKIPPEKITRPTGDRVKEALFNIIGADVAGTVFLDCFAGSGSMGIEALSRGAVQAHFIENNTTALRILKENLEKTSFLDKSSVWKGDVYGVLRRRLKGFGFGIIFLDPPYNYDPSRVLSLIEEKGLLLSGGIIILEASSHSDPFECPFWQQIENRVYGDTRLLIWQRE